MDASFLGKHDFYNKVLHTFCCLSFKSVTNVFLLNRYFLGTFLGTCELETIQAVQNIEGLSQLCEGTCLLITLKRLVDSITPPGFDNLYKQPKYPQLQDITNNSGYRRAFKPNLTSSPEVLLGKRCNREPSSSRKRIRLEDSCILLDTGTYISAYSIFQFVFCL
ncbi:hypothetical protein AMEX_G16957 [Astyanax mexicanus]|uniref:Uncharacterized protein n=1 Tax=Astyanax mexicanus TaxID=7994 RepID=A0A8T2LJ72_ASTMX|nr:hypothetical protein AMEX_G16957 [Astyanax mexicanus]